MQRRRSLVTGGTGGLGTAVVRRLLDRGDRVWVPWIVPAERDRLAETAGDAEQLTMVEADVTDAGRLEELRRRVEEVDGGLDVLCNLVGGFTMAPLAETGDDDWQRMVDLNARSVFTVTRAFAPLLAASGRGRIVNVAAAPAVRGGGGGMAAYTASKGAVVALTKALADELGPDGVAVNAVAPTTIDTRANREAMPDADRSRWVTPAEIASLIEWFTADDARVVTGNVVIVGR